MLFDFEKSKSSILHDNKITQQKIKYWNHNFLNGLKSTLDRLSICWSYNISLYFE